MTDSWISFDPVFPFWIVYAISTFLFLILVWTEWNRKLRFRSGRIIGQGLIMLSLLGLALQPNLRIKTSEQPILLLTKNYDAVIADSLIKVDTNSKVLIDVDAVPYKNAIKLTSHRQVCEWNGRIIYLLGEGLPLHTLECVNEKSYFYFPASVPIGITHLNSAAHYTTNRWNKIEGEYTNDSKATWLALKGPAGIEDSVLIAGKGVVPFSLSFYPKTTGKLHYQLIEMDSAWGKTISHTFPIEVLASKKLKIVFLSSFPTFEQRYLKNFLIEYGHEVTIRNQISRGRFQFEAGNQPIKEFVSLTSSLLAEVDLLMLDQASYTALSGNEKKILLKAVQDGLGLLALPDATAQLNEWKNVLALRVIENKPDTITISLEREQDIQLPSIPLQAEGRHTPLLTSKEGRTVSGYFFRGLGRVAFQFLQETYSLGLQGNKNEYAMLWTLLLEKTAREATQKYKLKIRTPFPWHKDEPVLFDLISGIDKPSVTFNGMQIPLQEDVNIDNVWQGKVWLTSDGWNTLHIDSTQVNFFASSAEEWNALRIANQLKENQVAAKEDFLASEGTKYTISKVDPIIFFIVLLLAATFIWLAPKV
jgi:hypothetical protein